jgi:preprotein translocase subunit SecG
MSFLIGLLSFVLVLICIALIFLVLIQLPKKEAGIGVAFGGGATDALFGAGSGTVLTKATKYAAIAFFVLAILVGMLQSHLNKANKSGFGQAVAKEQATPASAPAAAPATTPVVQPATTNLEVTPLMSQPTTAPTTSNAAPTAAPAAK